jgi:lipopolysaccharide transport system ATP-binding protein
MSNIAIRVEGLSKQYRIGGRQARYKTLRDTLADVAAAPFRAIRSSRNGSRSASKRAGGDDTVWALKDISFDVEQGNAVGIIGRNGAGKSTLLKILSMITEPTEGSALIQGRVGSLLEVGTGFHPELTGRENIYLNGAILGMKRSEIERKFDEIISFAEVERFIDTPVKHYSSGMYLRLAFSVAAHLEPDILLVDEVLAVGDIAFQKKCLGKMEDVATQGRTVLFVSHNLAVIKELCQTSVVLKDGLIDYIGPVAQGVARYSQAIISVDAGDKAKVRDPKWRYLSINGLDVSLPATLVNSEPFHVEAVLETQEKLLKERFVCIMYDATGKLLLFHRVEGSKLGLPDLEAGLYRLRVDFPPLWLAPGVYTLLLKFVGRDSSGEEHAYKTEPVILDVNGQDHSKGRAALAPPLDWVVSAVSASEANKGRDSLLHALSETLP